MANPDDPTPWYYLIGEEDIQCDAPVSEEELARLRLSGAITGESLVWCEGLEDEAGEAAWVTADQAAGGARGWR